MTAAGTATVIGAIAGALVAVTGVISALSIFWRELRTNSQTTQETKELVNGRYTALVAYQNMLIAALTTANVPVPPDPSGEVDKT